MKEYLESTLSSIENWKKKAVDDKKKVPTLSYGSGFADGYTAALIAWEDSIESIKAIRKEE